MADFGSVLFGNDYTGQPNSNFATNSTNSGMIGSFGDNIEQITKVGTRSSPQRSVCSTLSPDGASFACAWVP